MKNFFALIIAAFLLITAPAQAEDLGVELSGISAEKFNVQIEKFYATPVHDGEYFQTLHRATSG